MCSAIGAIGEGVLTNRIRLCILDMSGVGIFEKRRHSVFRGLDSTGLVKGGLVKR